MKERPDGSSKNCFECFVEGNFFHGACAMAIVLKAIFIGIQTDVSVKNTIFQPPHADPIWVRIASQVFVAAFVTDVFLRLADTRWRFFLCDEWTWNVF